MHNFVIEKLYAVYTLFEFIIDVFLNKMRTIADRWLELSPAKFRKERESPTLFVAQ